MPNRNPNRNPNCSGGHCTSDTGEVRLYPLGGGANEIFCRSCWAHENAYRAGRGEPSKWPMLDWNCAEVYGDAAPQVPARWEDRTPDNAETKIAVIGHPMPQKGKGT